MARPTNAEIAERLARGEADALLRELEPATLADALAVRLPASDVLAARGCPLLAQGTAAGVGVASGVLVLDAADAARRGADEPVVLVLRESAAEDVAGLRASVALVETDGGLTSEGAVMARGLGLPCVVGATQVRVDARAGRLTAPDPGGALPARDVVAGSRVTVCGTTGRLVLGEAEGAPGADQPALVALLAHAESLRTLRIVALARGPRELELARRAGADEIVSEGAAPERPSEVVAAVSRAEGSVLVAASRVALARLAAGRKTLAGI